MEGGDLGGRREADEETWNATSVLDFDRKQQRYVVQETCPQMRRLSRRAVGRRSRVLDPVRGGNAGGTAFVAAGSAESDRHVAEGSRPSRQDPLPHMPGLLAYSASVPIHSSRIRNGLVCLVGMRRGTTPGAHANGPRSEPLGGPDESGHARGRLSDRRTSVGSHRRSFLSETGVVSSRVAWAAAVWLGGVR